MINIFCKASLLMSLILVYIVSPSLDAWEDCCSCKPNRIYIGAFGGGIYSNSPQITHKGMGFFPEAVGGPLAILSRGHIKKTSTGFGGGQIGYEWSQFTQYFDCCNWKLTPAVEFEAYFFNSKKKAHIINPAGRLPKLTIIDTFHLNSSVLIANAVISLNSFCLKGFFPYIGGGIGAARPSISKIKSIQISPAEPGINHFNSNRNDSCWTFAAQLKAGIRYTICKSLHIFGEYRYLYLDSSNYIFGSTNYPNHRRTSEWYVKVNNVHYNAFSIGIQYDL